MGAEEIDPRQPADDMADDVAGCAGSHVALIAHLRGLGAVDPTAPSRLPDWTLGHVLTHIARNADGHLCMLDGMPQYPHGIEGRNTDIENGARRSWSELVDDVDATSAAVDDRYRDRDDWTGSAVMLFGEWPVSLLPLLRRREVEVHRVDLGLGHEFADMPADYVRKDLQIMETLWRARRPTGTSTLPDAALVTTPADRLAWMMGRIELPGLAPADLF